LLERLSFRKEDGFGLIETMIAMSMFAVISAPLVGVLLASVNSQKSAKERTLAAQTAQTAIESIRALPYDSIGVANGNPAGSLTPTQAASALGIGLDATVTTRVSFMDDAPATSYRTRADYKRVVVTVIRNADSKQLAQDVTYVAPPGANAIAGQSQGIVVAQIIDYALNTPLVGATVTLNSGPTPARTDLSDGSGTAVFPSLLPTTVSLDHYDVTTAFGAPYITLRDDLPPSTVSRTAISPGQTFQTVLRMYQPATIYVLPKNPNGSLYVGSVTTTVGSTRGTQSFTFTATGAPYAIPSIGGEQVVPNLSYTARILASNGTYSTPTTALVPTSYPTDLTKTFTLTLGGTVATMRSLTVKVVNSGGIAQANATVTVAGGPGSNVLLTGTTNASGNAVFSVPNNSSPGYTATANLGTLNGALSAFAVTATTTKTVTVS
jgi:type II secretory pathway pseudopilin PulG